MPTTNKTKSTKNTTTSSPVTAPAAPAAPVAPPAVPATAPLPVASGGAALASPTTAPSPTASPPPPPNATLVAYVQQSMATIDEAEAALAVDPPALTSTQKRRAAKLRSGGINAVGQIGTLARQYGIESSVLQVEAMLLALSDAQALQPLVVRLQAFLKHANDLLFLWQSAAWADAMQFYALLQRRALLDGSLAASLAPVAAFFAKRHASTKQPGAVNKRTAKANKAAVNRLKTSAPELLAPGVAETGQPTAGAGSSAGSGQTGIAAPAAAGGVTAAGTPAAGSTQAVTPAATNGANGSTAGQAGHS